MTDREIRIAYMCGVDFQHHLGDDGQPTKTYADVESLKFHRTCWKECGIVEVEVRVKSWPEPQNFA